MSSLADKLKEDAEMAEIFVDDRVAVAAMKIAAEYTDSDWAGSAQVIGMLGAILATDDDEARTRIYKFLSKTGNDIFNPDEEE